MKGLHIKIVFLSLKLYQVGPKSKKWIRIRFVPRIPIYFFD